MAFDFPNSPTDGQQYIPTGGPTYIWSSTGNVWKLVGGIGAPGNLSLGDTPPAGPAQGQMWLETDTGNLFSWWDDGNSAQWVQINVPANSGDFVKKTGDTMSGSLTSASFISGSAYFIGTTANAVLGTNAAAGIINLRPNGYADPTNQCLIRNDGIVAAVVGFLAGTFSPTGVTAGWDTAGGSQLVRSSKVGTASVNHYGFYNANGLVGTIGTTNSATAYNTSSDERLKDFGAELTLDEVMAVINADPAMHFRWKVDDSPAVGWSAQKSYAVSEDLASPGIGEPGDEDFTPWGMDQGKRTPYLWAAVSGLLKEIEALKARVAELEAV